MTVVQFRTFFRSIHKYLSLNRQLGRFPELIRLLNAQEEFLLASIAFLTYS